MDDTQSMPSLQSIGFRPPTTNYSCNACLRIAERMDVRIGSKLNMRGRAGKVIAINHEQGDLHCLVETAESTMLITVREAAKLLA